MKKACKALGIILLVGGIIGAIIVTKQLGVVSAISIYISVLILPVILLAIAEILENQEYIIKSNEKFFPFLDILAKEAEEREILSSGGWKCPVCDTFNRFYEKTCNKCGQEKPPYND